MSQNPCLHMDEGDIRQLIEMNNEFYRVHAASFSATRRAPWHGWNRVLDITRDAIRDEHLMAPLTVFDLACGNMRLERFVLDRVASARLYAVDSCAELLPERNEQSCSPMHSVTFQQLDVLDALLQRGGQTHGLFDAPRCALSVSFGFMHHVPSVRLRQTVLDALVMQAAPGGVVAVSFWQFMNNPRLAAKALAVTEDARQRKPNLVLAVNDYLLDWQGDGRTPRYCHHFDEAEIDALVAGLPAGSARELVRFSADGAGNAQNRYLVLQRR